MALDRCGERPLDVTDDRTTEQQRHVTPPFEPAALPPDRDEHAAGSVAVTVLVSGAQMNDRESIPYSARPEGRHYDNRHAISRSAALQARFTLARYTYADAR